jgi:NADPH:quinone reductase-like Zn-dependent oxidoreductase
MRAVSLARVPGSIEVTETDRPDPQAGELLVKVEASSINGFDLSTAAGYLQGMMEHRFPLIPGKDFAGTVEALGAGVTGFAVGDRVFGVVTKPYLGTGSLAQYVAVPAAIGVAHRPEAVSVRDAGALGLAGTAAAADALDALGPLRGTTVLVSGATGGVGALAVQLAAARGARVIATAKPGLEADFVRGLGAGDVVDYTGDLPAQVRALRPHGVDAVVHLAGDGAALAGLLTDTGRLASTLGFGADQHPAATFVLANPSAETLSALAGQVAAGTVSVPVTAAHPLEQAAEAFAAFAAGTLGKIAINVA